MSLFHVKKRERGGRELYDDEIITCHEVGGERYSDHDIIT